MAIVVVNYKGVITGVPLLPIEHMGLALVIALMYAKAVYKSL